MTLSIDQRDKKLALIALCDSTRWRCLDLRLLSVPAGFTPMNEVIESLVRTLIVVSNWEHNVDYVPFSG